jgi:hypothetical protein
MLLGSSGGVNQPDIGNPNRGIILTLQAVKQLHRPIPIEPVVAAKDRHEPSTGARYSVVECLADTPRYGDMNNVEVYAPPLEDIDRVVCRAAFDDDMFDRKSPLQRDNTVDCAINRACAAANCGYDR